MTAAAAQPTLPRTVGPPPNSPQFQAEYMHRNVWKAAVLGTINVLAIVLAARLIALVAVAGGIALTLVVLGGVPSGVPLDQTRLIALGIYAVGVALPVVVLSLRPFPNR